MDIIKKYFQNNNKNLIVSFKETEIKLLNLEQVLSIEFKINKPKDIIKRAFDNKLTESETVTIERAIKIINKKY